MKIFVNSSKFFKLNSSKLNNIFFVNDINNADEYILNQYIFNDICIKKLSLYIDINENIYCFDINKMNKNDLNYFFIGKLDDIDIEYKIFYYFYNLQGIALHTLSLTSNLVILNNNIFDIKNIISINELIKKNIVNENTIIKSNILSPSNLIIDDNILKVYDTLIYKINQLNQNSQLFFEDFILSLMPKKYWSNSLFFLKSNLKLKISNFFNKYNEIISLHIPVARSKFMKDFFEALLKQKNKNFKIVIGVDGYNEMQKNNIIKIIKRYKNKFNNFQYFVNKNNLGVGKTRRKLLNIDKKSRYVMFLDDDTFLSSNAIDFLYEKINKYPNMGIYSIENIDVKYDINYRDFIDNNGPFSQPGVFTNRERINRLPLYCDQEETPLIHDRFYSDLLDIKYNKVFDGCSVDMFFNRILETICGNVNLKGAFQFMRVGHRYHQTKTNGFELKLILYVIFILDKISYINNNKDYYTFLIKTLIPKQNDLFDN